MFTRTRSSSPWRTRGGSRRGWSGTIPHEWKALRKELDKLGPRSSVYCCYEAGPTGYGLARPLIAAGWACDVIAPSLVPKKSGQRIKTDRRDAMKLAQNHRAGELVAVFIPDEQTEAIRDLERARGAAKKAERVVRQQLSKFLLRHGKRYPGRTTWNSTHLAWIAKQTFDQPAQQYVLADGLAAVEASTLRVSQLTERLRELVRELASGAAGQGLAGDAWCRVGDGRDAGGGGGGLPTVRDGD